MKTKLLVRRNFRPLVAEMRVRQAVHVLQDATDDTIVLMQNSQFGIYLIPAILGENMEPVEWRGEVVERPPGTVEYQVSDGLPGHRSHSSDFYVLADAMRYFHELVANSGWAHATKRE